MPAPEDLRRFKGVGLPNSPSVNERDVSDKPAFVSGKAELTAEQLAELALRYECRLGALRSLDRSDRQDHDAIEASGELERHRVIFASDNGTFHGEHRLPGGKGLPTRRRRTCRWRCWCRRSTAAATPVVSTIDEPTSNIDLVPTIVDLAGAPTCVSTTSAG